jgi:hypothetical protein
MFEKEKSVDLSMFGIEQPVIVKRLTAGEKKNLDNALVKANNIKMQGSEVIGDLAPGDTALIAAKTYYKSGPFTVGDLDALDWEIVALIAATGDELNRPLVQLQDKSSS